MFLAQVNSVQTFFYEPYLILFLMFEYTVFSGFKKMIYILYAKLSSNFDCSQNGKFSP